MIINYLKRSNTVQARSWICEMKGSSILFITFQDTDIHNTEGSHFFVWPRRAARGIHFLHTVGVRGRVTNIPVLHMKETPLPPTINEYSFTLEAFEIMIYNIFTSCLSKQFNINPLVYLFPILLLKIQ